MNYEQMDLQDFDVMLDSERDLKENIGIAVEFACNQLASQDLPPVATRQEGYGLAAEHFAGLARAQKMANEAMKGFLQILPSGDSEAIFAASKLYDAAAEIAHSAVIMAAQANRIRTDLYHKMSEADPEKTPLEEYAESLEDEFEETEDNDVSD